MLKVTILEFLLRGIPESFIYFLAVYILSNTKFDKIKIAISSIALSLIIYLIRLLPIHFGVHTIIFIVMYILISVVFNKINTTKAISASLINTIILYVCEGINVFILQKILKVNMAFITQNPIEKIFYGTPALILFALTIYIIYRRMNKKVVKCI